MITHELADELGLKGTATTEWIELAGEKPKLWDTKYYIFTWHLPDGTVKQMKLLGMKYITVPRGKTRHGSSLSNLSPCSSRFP